jgi:hypothetical protein
MDRLASLFFLMIVVFFCSLLLTETETSVAIVEEDVVGDWDSPAMAELEFLLRRRSE